MLARVCTFLARSVPELSSEFLRATVPMLVNGTKEKNSFVKANCEFSLITVLKLKEGDGVHQVIIFETYDSLGDLNRKIWGKIKLNSQIFNKKSNIIFFFF